MTTRLLGLVVAVVMTAAGLIVGPSGASAGTDGEYCRGFEITIFAQGGVTNGTNKRDVILGSDGDDIINGKGGNDIICDESGVNVSNGDSGNDEIYASGEIYGGSGNDYLFGIEGVTIIDGGSGNDLITTDGFGYPETVHGGSGNDSIYLIYAGDVYGDAGADYIYSDGTLNSVDCGSGKDGYWFAAVINGIRRCEVEQLPL